MKIISTSGNGNFKIVEHESEFLELSYKNWFSSNASAHFNNKEIEIRPKNFWNTSFDIFRDGVDVGDIAFNWMSNAIISIDNERFLLKSIGIWSLKFEFLNEREDRLFLIKPSLNWKKMKYDYEIEIISEDYSLNRLVELLVYIGFSANLHMTATMRQ